MDKVLLEPRCRTQAAVYARGAPLAPAAPGAHAVPGVPAERDWREHGRTPRIILVIDRELALSAAHVPRV